jgi:hypothetical protein
MFIPILFLRRLVVLLVLLSAGGVPDPGGSPTANAPAPATPTTVTSTSTTEAEPPAPAGPAHLMVDDGDQHLAPGTYTGSFELTNTGGHAADWVWIGDPRVAVSVSAGTLAPGESIDVSFQVDSTALNPGSNLLANCVIYADGALDVWITVTRPSPPPTISPSFTS